MTTTNTQTPATTWSATLGQLQMIVTPANYDTWLRETIALRHLDGTFVVGAQNEFATEWLQTKLRPLILKTLARVLGHAVEIAFEVVRPHDAPPLGLVAADDDAESGGDAVPAFLRRASAPPPALNPALTFENFVVGDENRMAHDAARRVVDAPGITNPLTIVGAAGLGKTHLLSAIGHAAYARGLTVIYAPAERFGNDYVRALGGKLEQFRQRYRTADVLLIDDIQFLEGKEKFQDEFFHTFNDLHAAGKQIVVCGDRMPAQMAGLSDALRSRLQWGLAADLRRPSFATRLAILRAKARQHAAQLPEAALEAIAERCCQSVRELEGCLNRVLAYIPLVGGHATPDAVEKALSPFAASDAAAAAAAPDPDAIVAAVGRRTGVTPADIRGRSRSRDVTYARHLAMYLLKEDARSTIAEIGRHLGRRDHSTVLAGIARITGELKTRPETRTDADAAREALRNEAATSFDVRAS
jgi:chromosomal replication initiator protein